MAFASGLSATTTIVHLLKAGDHIVSADDIYGGTNRYVYFYLCLSTSFWFCVVENVGGIYLQRNENFFNGVDGFVLNSVIRENASGVYI